MYDVRLLFDFITATHPNLLYRLSHNASVIGNKHFQSFIAQLIEGIQQSWLFGKKDLYYIIEERQARQVSLMTVYRIKLLSVHSECKNGRVQRTLGEKNLDKRIGDLLWQPWSFVRAWYLLQAHSGRQTKIWAPFKFWNSTVLERQIEVLECHKG